MVFVGSDWEKYVCEKVFCTLREKAAKDFLGGFLIILTVRLDVHSSEMTAHKLYFSSQAGINSLRSIALGASAKAGSFT